MEKSAPDSHVDLQMGAKRDPGRPDRFRPWTLCCKGGELKRRESGEDRRDANCTRECVVSGALEVGGGVDGVELCCDLGMHRWVQRVPLRTDRLVFEREVDESCQCTPEHGSSLRDEYHPSTPLMDRRLPTTVRHVVRSAVLSDPRVHSRVHGRLSRRRLR